eukprot:gene53983-72142_t
MPLSDRYRRRIHIDRERDMPLPSRREVSIPDKDLIEAWLAGFRFDRFVTLAFNDPARRSVSIALASHDYQEERLREWD